MRGSSEERFGDSSARGRPDEAIRPRRQHAAAIQRRPTGRIDDELLRLLWPVAQTSQLIWRIGLRLNVVVPVHNEVAALPEVLRRLRILHERSGVDVVLVDGSSDDGGGKLLRASGLPCISAPRGRAGQMNAGAGTGRGDVILFLHADTRLPQEADVEIRAAINAGAVGGFFRVRLDSRRPLLRLVSWMITTRSGLTGVATGDQAIFMTREAFDQLGGFPPLPLFEDVEICTRLRGLGKIVRLEGTVTTSARRWENHGPWRTILLMWLLRAGYTIGLSPRVLARYYEATR